MCLHSIGYILLGTPSRRAVYKSTAFLVIQNIMANKENLRNIDEYNKSISADERTMNARKAGQASGEARREKKLIKDRILERMNATDWDEYIDGIIERAKESKADAEFLRDTIGEKPAEKHEVKLNEDVTLDRLREDFPLNEA